MFVITVVSKDDPKDIKVFLCESLEIARMHVEVIKENINNIEVIESMLAQWTLGNIHLTLHGPLTF